MSDGYINIAIKEKFNGTSGSRKHLSNKGKHIMRQHNEETLTKLKHKSFDPELSNQNSTLISQQKPGETLNQSVDRFIKENEIETPKRNTSIRAVAGIISIPSEYQSDPIKLKLFEEKAKEFLETNDKLKGNVILAQTNFDETQPHIEFVFVPRDNENPKKLDFTKLYGTDLRKGYDGSKSLEKLHDDVAERIGKPLGLKRGDGTNTKGLSNEQYLKSVSDMKNDEKELSTTNIKEPPKPLKIPQETLFNKAQIIQIQKQEIKELRDYIKETKDERNKLRNMKGILEQNRQVRYDKRDLRKKNKELQENNKLYQDVLGYNKPKKSMIDELREFQRIKKQKEEEEELKQKQKEERIEKNRRDRELIESMQRQKQAVEDSKIISTSDRKRSSQLAPQPPTPNNSNKDK